MADAWSLVTPQGVVPARIWLEKNPSDSWRDKWVVLAFFNRRGFEQGYTAAYKTGAEARADAEMWAGAATS